MSRRGSGPPLGDGGRDGPGRVEAPGVGAIAAGGDVVNSSTHVGDVYQGVPLPRAEEVDPPQGVPPRLPFRTRLFIGRAGMLAELDAALAGTGGAVVQAVHGLGGVGKSTLAAEWAYQHTGDHALTWWITADSAASITAGLADLAVMLVPELARDTSATTAVSLPDRAAWARQWLVSHSDWLVVLDNVSDPTDVAELVTSAPGGRFLITSRLREGWFDIVAALIELDVLSADEALALLRGIITVDRPGADLAGDAELCAELGYLPLAIRQAGAYIHAMHVSPARYRELLRANPAVMYDQVARGSDADRTVARIWRITLDTLADTPLAGELLRTMAWWAPQAIPRTMFDLLADAGDLTTALGDLAAYNMIDLDGATVMVHRMVQAVARTSDPQDPHRGRDDIERARRQAIDLLNEACPSSPHDPGEWPTWRTLLPHIDALAEHTISSVDSSSLAVLLNETGLFLADQGAVDRAISYMHRAVASNQRVLGDDDPATLASRGNLAYAYQSAGDLGRVIPLLEQALADCERVLGEDHPHTLTSRNNLASAYEEAGDPGRAIPLHEQTLADRVRLLGEDHPQTLTSRNNLAYAYRSAGDFGRAIPLHEQASAGLVRVLGEEHPYTLASRNNLAYAYKSAGDLGRAISLHEQALADCEQVLGEDHPQTLASRHDLAYVYEAVGDPGRAIPLYEQAFADRVRVLGEDHPQTLASRHNLANAYEAVGDPGRAIPLREQTLADCEQALGQDHPHTLTSRNNLASAYEAAGDPGQAIRLHEQTLADCERVLGQDHPDTLASRNNLAYAYRSTGDFGRVIRLHEQALADCERVLGQDHPHTLTSRNNLAYAYESAGDLGRAISLYEQALADSERVLGASHPATKTVRGNLATVRQAAIDRHFGSV